MFDQNSPFFQRSKIIAEEFLQTTVIVDDQAYFSDEISSVEAQSPTPIDLKQPGRESEVSSDKESMVNADESVVLPPYAIGSHRLNARKVINRFAQKRIVCSVIRPSDDDDNDWISSVENLASSADIIIIDWELNKDNGENALNILGQIIKLAIEAPAQLRLFAIYTGDPKIAQIAKDIKRTLEERLNVDIIDVKDDGFSLIFASTRIVIFAKPDTSNLPQEYEHRKVSFEDLADRVTSEFAVMTAGLVSNVALKSLAQVRNNTHKILNKFSIHLDAPYLTHRALQDNPEDAEQFLAKLIAEELFAILEEGQVGVNANLDAIKDWISSGSDTEFKLYPEQPNPFSHQEVITLLKDGIKKWNSITNSQKKKVHKLPLTEMFNPKTVNGQSLDEKFALTTTVRSSYEKRIPHLTFGTILQEGQGSNYWICIQPRCDCVRITSKRVFPFLSLEISQDDSRFNIVLEENGEYIKLVLNDKPYDLKLITFSPRVQDKGMIKARSEGALYYFISTGRGKYRWVGELRPEHSQRIANEFAANLSRVGLDESEWLRLWATKG